MAANVDYDFKNYFEIDEEKLRRIHSIVKKRVGDSNAEGIVFHIKRIDNYTYTTTKIEDVVSEDNDSISKITSIELHYLDDTISASILFSGKIGGTIRIKGEDRDNVFLLSSELKEYISNEVTIIKKWSLLEFRLLMPLVFIFSSLFVLYSASVFKPVVSSSLKEILESPDLNLKLNYLIERYATSNQIASPVAMVLITFTLIIVIIGSLPYERILNYIFPKNIFLLGKQIPLIEKRRKTNSNIFWVIIIGSTISVVVAYFTSKLFS